MAAKADPVDKLLATCLERVKLRAAGHGIPAKYVTAWAKREHANLLRRLAETAGQPSGPPGVSREDLDTWVKRNKPALEAELHTRAASAPTVPMPLDEAPVYSRYDERLVGARAALVRWLQEHEAAATVKNAAVYRDLLALAAGGIGFPGEDSPAYQAALAALERHKAQHAKDLELEDGRIRKQHELRQAAVRAITAANARPAGRFAVTVPPRTVAQGIARLKPFTHADITRGPLCMILHKGRDLVATDGHRLVELPVDQHAAEPLLYKVREQADADARHFPGYAQVIPNEQDGAWVLIDVAGLRALAQWVSATGHYGGAWSKPLVFRAGQDVVPTAYEGGDVRVLADVPALRLYADPQRATRVAAADAIGVDPNFLADALAGDKSPVVSVQLPARPLGPLRLLRADGERWIIMPVRIAEVKAPAQPAEEDAGGLTAAERRQFMRDVTFALGKLAKGRGAQLRGASVRAAHHNISAVLQLFDGRHVKVSFAEDASHVQLQAQVPHPKFAGAPSGEPWTLRIAGEAAPTLAEMIVASAKQHAVFAPVTWAYAVGARVKVAKAAGRAYRGRLGEIVEQQERAHAPWYKVRLAPQSTRERGEITELAETVLFSALPPAPKVKPGDTSRFAAYLASGARHARSVGALRDKRVRMHGDPTVRTAMVWVEHLYDEGYRPEESRRENLHGVDETTWWASKGAGESMYDLTRGEYDYLVWLASGHTK